MFIACDAVKRAWRRANPQIVGFWNAIGDAITSAMNSSRRISVGRISVERRGSYLLVRLPSGRYLSYPSPRISKLGADDTRECFNYFGVNQYSRKWERIRSHGPKVVENVTQAVACDLLCEALVRLDAQGYKAVLHVHDEIIADVPNSPRFSVTQMETLMCTMPEWASDIPLAAAGFESFRYRKD